ncbi:MAG TPA: hypothetical protein DCX54_00235 [Flavobacteriales bacterium]|nr:hypothetical protein [Flavobacteriales bacterium]
MLSIFRKQKIQVQELATEFVDAFLPTVYEGFPEVAAIINESIEFVQSPKVDPEDLDRFLLICLAANTMAVQQCFSSEYDQAIIRNVLENVALKGGVTYEDLHRAVHSSEKFIAKVNHPSKNILYGMSKAIFYKYNLSQFQVEYFRKLNSPNPIFLKRLDDALECFLWNWEDHSNN